MPCVTWSIASGVRSGPLQSALPHQLWAAEEGNVSVMGTTGVPGALGSWPGPCPWKNRLSHFLYKSVPLLFWLLGTEHRASRMLSMHSATKLCIPLKWSPFPKTQRGRGAAKFKFKSTMLGARSNGNKSGMKLSLLKCNGMMPEE